MSSYRFLEDAWVGQFYFQAGDTASTADVGGTLPTGWVPNGNVDPLDTAAVTAFHNAGVQLNGLVRAQFSNQAVEPPVTYWVETAGTSPTKWTLTGLGAALAPILE